MQVAGTVAFAVTAVLAVAPKGIDLFGACVMGIITAIGGGTIRDLILDVPVFWANELSYIWIAFGASLV
ncbi:MAG: TRIC cation channel family protein, partial [Thiohalocapsa sp.]